jgi:hypothetical protein
MEDFFCLQQQQLENLSIIEILTYTANQHEKEMGGCVGNLRKKGVVQLA